ncbi:MAG TPA: hypothetical protein PK402_08685 [Tepidisphaeraceae bacterium]|nr:hypothetical protein [Tepidisphaeraceae bacterium]
MRYTLGLRRWIAIGLLSFTPAVYSDDAQNAPGWEATEKRAAEFLRFDEHNDGSAQLQTCIIRYKNDDGVTVDLIGAVHIADGAYYTKLNERFKTYDALLYEMVKPKDVDITERMDQNEEGGNQSFVTMIQKFMKDQLELEFQLDGVDYAAKNFVHADLDAETFAEMQAERGESMFTLMLQEMLKGLTNPETAEPGEEMSMFELIEALQSPDSARSLKLILGRQFGKLEASTNLLGGDGSVIVGERNKQALKVLRSEVDAGKKNIGIFYGAAHLPGMQEIMVDLMGFKQVGEPEWITAWDIAPESAVEVEPEEVPASDEKQEIIPV